MLFAHILAFGSEFGCAPPAACPPRQRNAVAPSCLGPLYPLRSVLQRGAGAAGLPTATESTQPAPGGGRCLKPRDRTKVRPHVTGLFFVSFAAGFHCALSGARRTVRRLARGPNSPCSWAWGAPFPLLRFPWAPGAHPPRVWRATGERCPPTAGFFFGWRMGANMVGVVISPCPRQQAENGALDAGVVGF